MILELYTFEDGDGHTVEFTTRDIEEARRYARANKLKLIAQVFEWSESELVEDNTPPKKPRKRRRKK